MANPLGTLIETLGLMVKEGRRRLLSMAFLGWALALLPLPLGAVLPKRWDASTVVLVESSTLIQPLMEGRAVSTDAADQTSLIEQTIKSRRIMREILAFRGELTPNTDAVQEERLLGRLRSRMSIGAAGPSLVRLSYHDKDPEWAYKVTKKLAEIYIREGAALQERQSRQAFEFIDRQVREYATKLADAHESVLKSYRHEQAAVISPPPPQPMAAAPAPAHPATPAATANDAAAAELAALEARLNTPPKPPSPQVLQNEQRLSEEVGRLRAELERTLAKYTTEHPEAVRLRGSLNRAEQDLRAAQRERMAREQKAALNDAELAAMRTRANELRGQLGSSAPARPRSAGRTRPAALAPPTNQDPKLAEIEENAEFLELLRRYEATRDVYQDLLKRRENARVSMDLDTERRGLTLRVQEPAEMPATASSLRFLHLSAIGMVLAVGAPLGLLFALVQYDGRVRCAPQITRLARVPVLGTIPASPRPEARRRWRRRMALAVFLGLSVVATYATVFIVRLTSS